MALVVTTLRSIAPMNSLEQKYRKGRNGFTCTPAIARVSHLASLSTDVESRKCCCLERFMGTSALDLLLCTK